ncbi:YicC/YloC family endoribonuclease [Roseibaca sp. Y0-43]|uniref:YicC/YloC family endoribonuclease n=1 Tax=Roseibaca sp. Y0-43 TaxID=2816854 RepID=UPI001D0C1566|nr:YicC/YloC family endoribonuclease [Roseibaca sp. Y0-43]MCC1480481.1 YicC family protein [Roseibaca sp. Y0-43]
MLHSMTGYASRQGAADLAGQRMTWDWELRAVNGRGLDLRLRLPDGFGFLEKPLRDKLSAQISRGNVALSLRLRAVRPEGRAPIDEAALQDLFQTLAQMHAQAAAKGLDLRAPTTLDVLSWRGLNPDGHDAATIDTAELGKLLLADMEGLLAAFNAARQGEGQALHAILSGQIDQIAALVLDARARVPERAAALRTLFQGVIAQFTDGTQADPARLEQELALQAVKSDLSEELDRLDAHCAAARALLSEGGAIGRRLDFLTQEFNREANTLCSKAQHIELTRIGLEMKSVIDQMREQVQNLE